jgi:hypothetical protein
MFILLCINQNNNLKVCPIWLFGFYCFDFHGICIINNLMFYLFLF